MNNKVHLQELMKGTFTRWDELLATLSDDQITAPNLPDGWSIKDVIAHLWGWQQRSVARTEAALNNTEPKYPDWPKAFDPDAEEDVDQTNDWIYQANRDKSWPTVYSEWRTQFQQLLELAERVPENDLLDPERYRWMEGYPLSASHEGTYEHHEEHYDTLLAWLNEHKE